MKQETILEKLKNICLNCLANEPSDPTEREIGYSAAMEHIVQIIDKQTNKVEKQTAVEWLINQIEEKGDTRKTPYTTIIELNLDTSEYNELIKQAKEMEKEQIINSWDLSRRDIDYPANGEQYYNQRFGKKEETNYEIGRRMKRKGYGISDSYNSVITTNPNNEPTNEEIEEWMRGYNDEKAELEEKKTSLNLESLEQKLDNALEIETTESLTEFVNEKRGEQVEDLAYWKANAEEDYLTTPISVLRYIVVLEKELLTNKNK